MEDFRKRHRERNWNIWRMRVLEKRTLPSIAHRFDLSRERVRQIVTEGNAIKAIRLRLENRPDSFGRNQ
jgi:DNA-directed RNA polymerase sigma subunit (sigma70/sigma32)